MAYQYLLINSGTTVRTITARDRATKLFGRALALQPVDDSLYDDVCNADGSRDLHLRLVVEIGIQRGCNGEGHRDP